MRSLNDIKLSLAPVTDRAASSYLTKGLDNFSLNPSSFFDISDPKNRNRRLYHSDKTGKLSQFNLMSQRTMPFGPKDLSNSNEEKDSEPALSNQNFSNLQKMKTMMVIKP
jgi:hypothetical protein